MVLAGVLHSCAWPSMLIWRRLLHQGFWDQDAAGHRICLMLGHELGLWLHICNGRGPAAARTNLLI